jgi:uncharacterized protein with HEPN domain
MSKHLPKVLIIDMVDAIHAILDFTYGLTYEDFMVDRKTRDAVYRNIMVLGEATTRLPISFMQEHSAIEWQKMISARNALVHGYDKIDDRIVWNISQNILPGLKQRLEKLLIQL